MKMCWFFYFISVIWWYQDCGSSEVSKSSFSEASVKRIERRRYKNTCLCL